MASLTLTQRSSSLDPDKQSYRLVLEITSSEDIPKEVFVKQRFINYKRDPIFDDVFVAVATPVQIEDYDKFAPRENTSFFRDSKIDLISRNIDYLEQVKTSILWELDKLVEEWNALNVLSAETITVIN